MAKTRRAHDEEAWTNAKKICRLNARQVEMARALGMNPRKLPGCGSIDRSQAREELSAIAEALETGAPISPMPAVPSPPRQTRPGLSRWDGQARTLEDDETPF
jgi:hypothetical protein